MCDEDKARANDRVRTILRDTYGFDLTPIPVSEVQGVKTPDFEFLLETRREFTLEVKTAMPEREWPPAAEGEHVRRSPAAYRIGDYIFKAYTQLNTYAPGDPKVLVILNWNRWLDWRDLDGTFLGREAMAAGPYEDYWAVDPRFSTVAHGERRNTKGEIVKDISEIKYRIDLYVWIDDYLRERGASPQITLRSPEGTTDLSRWFHDARS